jgi:hypothetical protein
MATSAERKAHNQGVFRSANEKLEQKARDIVGAEADGTVPFLCECPRQECTAVVLLTLAEYEVVRSVPERGLAKLGHEDPEVELVVDRNERFLMTEKFGRAGEVHAARDPRS